MGDDSEWTTGRRQPRLVGRLLLPVCLAVVLAACGGEPASPGGDPQPGGSANSSVPDSLPGTPAEVEEALLTLEELGEGWVDLGAVPLDERGFEGCPESRVITGGDDSSRLGEAQSLYGQGDPPVITFGESVSLWESPEVAAEKFAASASGTSQCRSFEQEMPDGRTATVRVLPGDAPNLGDESAGLVIEANPDEGPTILRDVVLVRVGDVIVLTEGVDRVVDDPRADAQRERFEELTRQAVDKVSRTLSD